MLLLYTVRPWIGRTSGLDVSHQTLANLLLSDVLASTQRPSKKEFRSACSSELLLLCPAAGLSCITRVRTLHEGLMSANRFDIYPVEDEWNKLHCGCLFWPCPSPRYEMVQMCQMMTATFCESGNNERRWKLSPVESTHRILRKAIILCALEILLLRMKATSRNAFDLAWMTMYNSTWLLSHARIPQCVYLCA